MDETGASDFQKIILGERAFLHDISNKLVIVQGMGGSVLAMVKKREVDNPESKELARMEKTMKAAGDMIDMVRERRELLKSVSNK